MTPLPVPEMVSHALRVKSLYKAVLRNLESWIDRREVYRYYAALMRAKFERNMRVKDRKTAVALVDAGVEELRLKGHYHVRKFPCSPLGSAFEREVIPNDWMVDHWHPLEKAQYPDYFAKREQLKKIFIQMWKEKYNKE